MDILLALIFQTIEHSSHMTTFLRACLYQVQMETQSCLCGIVCCHSMNIVLVCPMQALSCTQSVSMSDSLSQNQTTCPTQAFSVSNSDSLCHNHLMHILLTCETCVLSVVILLLPWLLRYSLSQSQTVCLELRQSIPCTSCWHVKVMSGNQSLASRVLHTVCLKVGQSVLRTNSLSLAHPASTWKLCLASCDTFGALTPSVHSVSILDSLPWSQTGWFEIGQSVPYWLLSCSCDTTVMCAPGLACQRT